MSTLRQRLHATAGGLRDWLTGRRGRGRQVLVWILIIAVVLRVSAPMILTRITNSAMADGEKVRGSITGVSLGLLTGDYTVHGLELRIRRDGGTWVPLLDIADIRCDLEWLPLLRGELIGHGTVNKPVLHVFASLGDPTAVPTTPEDKLLTDDRLPTPPWQEPIRTVIHARLTSVTIADGEIRYTDERRGITTSITEVAARIDELIIPQPALTHRCPCHLTAKTPGNGMLRVDGEVDILSPAPTFLARARLEHVDLVSLNPITARIDNLTFHSGTFSGYAEVVADGRRLGGYLKVLFHDLDIRSFGDAGDGKGTGIFWSLVLEIAEELLENTQEHQHAARIPLSGPLQDPDSDVWTALGTALRNAFVRALAPGFEKAPKIAASSQAK